VHGGASDIQNFWSQATQQLGDVKCTTLDVKPLGRSAAREIGNCTFKTKGATPQDGALKYAVVWQKVGGEWKLGVDMWNMDK
jgi:ketosteroid isomerase-like protein